MCFVVNSAAQSGRVKESPTPTSTPRSLGGPLVLTIPEAGRPKPTPSPTPEGDDDIIKVESALVPIPVSVIDNNGRAVATLKLADFELKIDGKLAEIGEISRSDTPIRLAMLFDNSSSVTIAREFEKKAAIRFFRRVIRPDKDLAALFSIATVIVWRPWQSPAQPRNVEPKCTSWLQKKLLRTLNFTMKFWPNDCANFHFSIAVSKLS